MRRPGHPTPSHMPRSSTVTAQDKECPFAIDLCYFAQKHYTVPSAQSARAQGDGKRRGLWRSGKLTFQVKALKFFLPTSNPHRPTTPQTQYLPNKSDVWAKHRLGLKTRALSTTCGTQGPASSSGKGDSATVFVNMLSLPALGLREAAMESGSEGCPLRNAALSGTQANLALPRGHLTGITAWNRYMCRSLAGACNPWSAELRTDHRNGEWLSANGVYTKCSGSREG